MADREMTNEEAIEILGGIRACYNVFDEYDEPKYAALSKAIFALKADPIEVRAAYEQKAYNKGYADGMAGKRQARWKGAGMGDYMCSLCATVVSGNRYHYCPNCGARMDEVEE